MAVRFVAFLPFLILFQYGLADYKTYAGYKVYEIIPKTRSAQSHLRSMSLSTEAYDFWTMAKEIGKKSVVMVPPEHQKKFEKSLRKFKISYTISVKDVAPMVKADQLLQTKSSKTTIQNIQFKRYFRYNFILRYMDGLAKKYPDLVTVKTIGHSFEKRKIKAIHISNKSSNDPKNTILIESGMHGREWIGPATALYIIHKLVTHSRYRNMNNSLNWVILPVANPDGYEYTHTKERFWVKNRKPTNWCFGTDINRNFDFHWGEETGSSNPCSANYHGQKAFSEPETVALKSLMESVNGTCKFYLSLNSFGQHLLYPWSYDDSLPNNWKDIDDVAQEGASAIRSATGTQYVVNSFSKILYKASGGSNDYALNTQNIPISIAMTLPSGGREGLRGFHPQPTKIISIASESWIGIKAMAMLVDKKFSSVNTGGADGSMNTGGDGSMNANDDDDSTIGDTNGGSDGSAINVTGNYGSTNVNPSQSSNSTGINATVNDSATNVNPSESSNSTAINATVSDRPTNVNPSNSSNSKANATINDSPTNVKPSEGINSTNATVNDGPTNVNPSNSSNSTAIATINDVPINVNPSEGSNFSDINTTVNDGPTNVNPAESGNSPVVNVNGDGLNANLTGEGDSTFAESGSTVINATENGNSTNLSPNGGYDPTVNATGGNNGSANIDPFKDGVSTVVNASGNSTNVNSTGDNNSTFVDTTVIDGGATIIDATGNTNSTNISQDGGDDSTNVNNSDNYNSTRTGDGDSAAANSTNLGSRSGDNSTNGSNNIDTARGDNSKVDASRGCGPDKVNATGCGDSTVLNLTVTTGT